MARAEAEGPARTAGPFALERLRALLRWPELPEYSLESYRRERAAQLALPIAFALMEGGFIGVIADKIFRVHPALLALISAAPMFGNLSSVFWARLAQGRRKIPLIVTLQAAFAVTVAGVALVPETARGGALLVTLMVASRLLIGGLLTVRSVVWTLNYPSGVRARVTSWLSLMAIFIMTAVTVAGSLLLDADPRRFRWIYAAGALSALLGSLFFARVRLRGEEARGRPPLGALGDGATSGPQRPGVVAMLRADPLYARYLGWQFLLGFSNMMIEPPLLYLVSRELQASYTASVAITVAIPLGLSMFTMPLWAAYIDRVHVARFRARHSWLWVLSQALTFWGAASASLPLLAFARVVLGTARSGGMLAWQLGHNDFAKPERAGLYMGIHATLTGLRGAFAPFFGMWLYLGWSGAELGPLHAPGFGGIGSAVMAAGAVLSAIATLGFVGLQRRIESRRG